VVSSDIAIIRLSVYQSQFVNVQLAGVHKTGVTKVGLLANTRLQLQVSSDITQANSAEVVAHTFVLFKAQIAILAVQSKEVHQIVLAVSKAVAVQAFQLTVVWSQVLVQVAVHQPVAKLQSDKAVLNCAVVQDIHTILV